MNTKHNHKKSIIAAVAGAAVPAFLFAGAGTAQAYTGINLTPGPGGVTVHVNSVGFCLKLEPEKIVVRADPGQCEEGSVSYELGQAHISHGQCTYKAVPQTFGLLPVSHQFPLRPGGKAEFWLPGPPTGTTWDVSIHCPNGTDSAPQQLVY